jgi:hypothetical protein
MRKPVNAYTLGADLNSYARERFKNYNQSPVTMDDYSMKNIRLSSIIFLSFIILLLLLNHRLDAAVSCAKCNGRIQGRYVVFEGKEYHSQCYRNFIQLRCDVCQGPIEGKYYIDAWNNNIHSAHKDAHGLCQSCSRVISRQTSGGGVEYSDGRKICNICRKSAVDLSSGIGESKKLVYFLLSQNGLTGIPEDLEIMLVSKKVLAEKSKMKNDALRGYTESKMKFLMGKKISADHTIYILYGLPRLQFEGVLAHELLHVWLNERLLAPESTITEGFCNLGTAMVYEKKNNDFSKILLKVMAEDPDPDYGDGFRRMSAELNRLGWKKLIQGMNKYKQPPPDGKTLFEVLTGD